MNITLKGGCGYYAKVSGRPTPTLKPFSHVNQLSSLKDLFIDIDKLGILPEIYSEQTVFFLKTLISDLIN
jgi:hypothetical protein